MEESYIYKIYRRIEGEKENSESIGNSYSLERALEKIRRHIERNGDEIESSKDIDKLQKDLESKGQSKDAVAATSFADETDEEVLNVYYDITAELIETEDEDTPQDPIEKINNIIKKYKDKEIEADAAILEIENIITLP